MKKSKFFRFSAAALAFVMILSMTVFAAPTLTGETSRTTQTIRTGAVYTQIKTPSTSPYKTQSVNVVEVDLSQRNLYMDVAYGNMSSMLGASTVKNTMTKFATDHPDRTPLAGVNGAPWNVPAMDNSSEGAKGAYAWTFGFTYANGEIYCTNDAESDFAVGISEDFVPIFGAPFVEINLTQGNKTAMAEHINRMPRNDRIVLYTDRVMKSTNNFAADDAYELLVDFGQDYTLTHGTSITGTITAKYGPNDSTNPPKITANQMVLTARGSAIADLEQFTVGQPITIDVTLYDRVGDSARWQKARTIAGGFFPLMINGVTSEHNFGQKYPATIVGTNRDGKFVMITLDGRGVNGGCEGLNASSIHENLLEDLGMYNALLLDGGGSATMVVNKNGTYTTVNTPSDGSDRSVRNAWILSYGPERQEQGDTSLESITAGIHLDPTHVTFEDKLSVSSLVYYSHDTDYEWDKSESIKLTATGGDCYVGFNYRNIKQTISADEYKYASIVYKLDSANTHVGQGIEVFFGANSNDAVVGQNVQSTTGTTKNKWLTCNFDASELTLWNGRVSYLRIDFFTSDCTGDTMYIHDIVLGRTAQEASEKATAVKDYLNAPASTTFKFNMHDHGTAIPSQTLLKGEKPTRPADPTADGWVFLGWYTSSVSDTLYDWNAIPTKTTTVHARWAEDPNAVAKDYQLTGWTWNGYDSATATFTDQNNPSDVQTRTATITNAVTTYADCTNSGVITYTASVMFDYVTYTDHKTKTIPAYGHNFESGVCTECGESDPNYDPTAVPSLIVSNATAYAGGQVQVTVSLAHNPGITTLVVSSLEYDSSVLTLTNAESCGLFSSFTKGRRYVFDDYPNVTDDGDLMTLTFNVDANAPAGEYTVRAVSNDTSDEDLEDVILTPVAGTITVLPNPNAPKLVVADVSTTPGGQVSVTVAIENNPGAAALKFRIGYDASVFTYNSAINGGMFSSLTVSQDHMQYLFDEDGDVTADGILTTLVFDVDQNAPVGDYTFTVTVKEASNYDLEDVVIADAEGTITVSAAAAINYGDANGDGVISIKDVTLLRRYIANFDDVTGTSTESVEAGADANGDGEISNKDIILIRKYIANFDDSTGTSTVVLGPTNGQTAN